MGAIISVDGDKWEPSFPYVVSGHIHSKQSPQENIYYTGSALQHAFGESEDNTIAILEFGKSRQKYNLIEYDLDMPKKKIVYTTIDDIEKVKPCINSNVKLTISGDDYNEFKAFKKTEKYKNLVESGAKVVFKTIPQAKNSNVVDEEGEKPNFKDVVYSLCLKEPDTLHIYNLIVNNSDSIDI